MDFWNKKAADEASSYNSVYKLHLLNGGNKNSFCRIAVRTKTNNKYEYLMKEQSTILSKGIYLIFKAKRVEIPILRI